jgi:hypothetical protein
MMPVAPVSEKKNLPLEGLVPISLKEMDSVSLMNRTDTKFLLSIEQLNDILPLLAKSYRVLEIEGNRSNRYQTLYYDTSDFFHYLQHQNGKRHRYKIRQREYMESGLSFIEVKEKSNKGRTDKSRIKTNDIIPELNENAREFIASKSLSNQLLEPKLWNYFSRITLVSLERKERVTLDTGIGFYFGEQQLDLKNLVIAEVKQDGNSRHSPFMVEMKKRIIRPEGVSKYCLGVALMFPHVKSNNFKEKILRILKITS